MATSSSAEFGVNPVEVAKPEEIHLLLSMACNFLHPVPMDKKKWAEGTMILYQGIFGKVFVGKCNYIRASQMKICHPTSVVGWPGTQW